MAAVFDERGASPRFRSDVSKVVSSGGFDDVDAAKGGVDLVVEADASLTKVVVAEAGSAEGVTEDGGVGKGREDEKIGAAGGIGEGCDVGGGAWGCWALGSVRGRGTGEASGKTACSVGASSMSKGEVVVSGSEVVVAGSCSARAEGQTVCTRSEIR